MGVQRLMKSENLTDTLFSRPREVHAYVIGLGLTLLSAVIDPFLLWIPFSIGVGALGAWTVLDIVPGTVEKYVRSVLDSKYGIQIEKEVAYYFGGMISGYILFELLRTIPVVL